MDLLREWREKLGPETVVSDDQKAINDVYDLDTIRAHRDFIVLPYDKYARCKRGHPTKGVPCVWHPYMERTFPPVPNQPLVWGVPTKLENSLARSNQSRFG